MKPNTLTLVARDKARKALRMLPDGDSTIAVEDSGNSKTGRVSATYASQASCPKSCPFMGSGCYAEPGAGRVGLTTMVLNASQARGPVAIARAESRAIDTLTGRRKLRVHVVGDCKTAGAAKIVGAAMKRHESKHGMPAWTYTHAWRDVPVSAWQGAAVLASCEKPSDVKVAHAAGYATALVVQRHESRKVYQRGDVKVLPCPQQFGATDCERCGICMNPETLRKRGLTVGFAVHGSKQKDAANQL